MVVLLLTSGPKILTKNRSPPTPLRLCQRSTAWMVKAALELRCGKRSMSTVQAGPKAAAGVTVTVTGVAARA